MDYILSIRTVSYTLSEDLLESTEGIPSYFGSGRLAYSMESGGEKRRIFMIENYVAQRALPYMTDLLMIAEQGGLQK